MPFNYDTKSIFDRYVISKLFEQTEAKGPLAGEFLKGEQRLADLKNQFGETHPNYVNELKKFYGWMKQNEQDILGRPPEPTQGELVKTSTATAPSKSLAGTQGGSAPSVVGSATKSPATAQAEVGEITQQQKDLFKKLHGTSYNPNSSMDKNKMGLLQTAGSEVGYDDIGKLTNTAYAKQYAGSSKGDTYAKKAGIAQNTAKSDTSTSNQTFVNEPSPDLSLSSSQPIKMNLSSPVGLAASAGTGSSNPTSTASITPTSKAPTSTNAPAPKAPKTPTGTNTPAPKAPKAPLSNKKASPTIT
jgi:hypothetical protein